MAKMIYDESYGTISWVQRTAYRKYNVSPSDHQDLIDEFGEQNHATITGAVKAHSGSGMYRAPVRW